jgi:5'-nucleotidase
MRVLVTNDDGFDAPGLAVLARAFVEAGHDVRVVAPLTEASGSGAAIGPVHLRGGTIRIEEVAPDGLEGIKTLAVDALPALIVITACLGGFGPPPELIVSGINPGRNVGRAVMHSGTVGAALTSAPFGLKGLATSIQAGSAPLAYESADGAHIHYESAAALAVVVASHIETAPARTVINLNVPNLPLGEIRGIRRAHLAKKGLIFSARLDERKPDVQLDLRAQRAASDESASDDQSDDALTEQGWAVVTPLASVTEDHRPDVGRILDAAVESASRLVGM